MPNPRTPRQAPGEELVACSIMVPPDLKRALVLLADKQRRSISQVGRRAIEVYVQARHDDATGT